MKSANSLQKWASWLKTGSAESYVSTSVLRAIAAKFWGGEDAVDFSTTAGKARAAKIIQDRQYAKESLVLCDLVWPAMDDASTRDHVGDPELEARLFTTVTGMAMDEQELRSAGERVFNLNRAMADSARRRGRADDVLSEIYFVAREEPPADIFDIYNPERFLPGKGDKLISFKAKALDRDETRALMDEIILPASRIGRSDRPVEPRNRTLVVLTRLLALSIVFYMAIGRISEPTEPATHP